MIALDQTARDYIAAYHAANGHNPEVEMRGDRYSVATRTGFFAKYTKGDLAKLTRALSRMAGAA